MVKEFLTDCKHNKIGNNFHSIMMVDLMILCSSLMVSINCSVRVAFCNSAIITGKSLATLRSLGVVANSEEFRTQLIWARDHPHSQEAKSLNAKVSRILSMVGSTIPYSPFEHAVTQPKLNAMQHHYGVGSNFIIGVPPEFEDLLTLRLCMKPKYNDPNCDVSK